MKASLLYKIIMNMALQIRNSSSKIAFRIALLSWLIALFTLLIFAMLNIPEQKKAFLQNLESKAKSVAVALHDSAAAAAITEDYASVVSAAQTMLAGDEDIEFLIVAKNDGFALIMEKNKWLVEFNLDKSWYHQKRASIYKIQKVPIFEKRVFYYGQPFDYSGIEWGWIHVGLSLKNYDQNISQLYKNTLLLGLACILFSLFISVLYAKQFVRPIGSLRSVVQRFADGDLTARANIVRSDELGSLAKSVNIMADALAKRNNILDSVRFFAAELVNSSHWEIVIPSIMAKIGKTLNVSRCYIFQTHQDEKGIIHCYLNHEWTENGGYKKLFDSGLQNFSYPNAIENWIASLGQNQFISGLASEMSKADNAVFEAQDIHAIVVIPISVGDARWGSICIIDDLSDRLWSDVELNCIRTLAEMLGTTIARQNAQEALLRAKSTLEERVKERTFEIENQMKAKEHALTQLAEMQTKLIEMSRAAGMAEVATGVLHNVGNVLNSVNVSCTLIREQLLQSRVQNISKLASLITEAKDNLSQFLTEDPRGRQIPDYLCILGPTLEEERQILLNEVSSLRERIDHIKEIVAMQQSYARVSGVKEKVMVEQLMEDAMTLNAGALARHGITVHRHYESVPPINVDKHKVLQILLNLINNAKYACIESKAIVKIITLRILHSQKNGYVKLQVEDNGRGIPPENMTRIFEHGFTTRKDGKGFGLHSSALAAHELGGRLTVHSNGLNTGATFTLELPYL